jgi:hypothetical protein
MTTVGELFHSLERGEVIAAIGRLYPEEPGDWPDGYERAWQTIVAMEAGTPSKMVCELYQAMSLGDPPEPYIGVHGVENGESYAIEYTPWPEWLAMPVQYAGLPPLPAVETLAHIFWEMTWIGYDAATISERLTDLTDRVDEIKEAFGDGQG